MPAPIVPLVGRTLAGCRRSQRLTLRQLAKLSGISYIKIHYFEHGLQPRPDEVRRLAAALGCSVADLRREVRHV